MSAAATIGVLLKSIIEAARGADYSSMRLRKIERANSNRARRTLSTELQSDGFNLEGRRSRISNDQLDALCDSFRLGAGERRSVSLSELLPLRRGNNRAIPVVLLSADSGLGKSTLAQALAARRRGPDATYFHYVDTSIGVASTRAAAHNWLNSLSATSKSARRNVLVLDGVNEALSSEDVCEIVSSLSNPIETAAIRHDVVVLVMFSFRHRSYARDLWRALGAPGETLELLFNPLAATDQAFFRYLLAPESNEQGVKIDTFLRKYVTEYPDWRLTRKQVAALVRDASERGALSSASPELIMFPSPAKLVANRFFRRDLPSSVRSGADFTLSANVMFEILGSETMWIPENIENIDSVLRSLRNSGVATSTSSRNIYARGDANARVEDEDAVRVFGALKVAKALAEGELCRQLSGSTRYDVAAPYVRPALEWIEADFKVVASTLAEALMADAPPFSFLSRIIFDSSSDSDSNIRAPQTDPIGALGRDLLTQMIAEINVDRALTSEQAVRRAAARETDNSARNPVLDQLFETMDGCGASVIPELLSISESDETDDLARSQIAYLLDYWLRMKQAEAAPGTARSRSEDSLRETILERGIVGSRNLHLRFHEAEILANLSPPTLSAAANSRRFTSAASRLRAAGYTGGEEQSSAYRALHDSLTEYVSAIERCDQDPAPEVVGLRKIWRHTPFGSEPGDGNRISERGLECWEVAIGLTAKAFARNPSSCEWARDPIEQSLASGHWIVRWWAFSALLVMRRASPKAAWISDAMIDQLLTATEPTGLKLRECKLIESEMRRGDRTSEELGVKFATRYREFDFSEFSRSYSDWHHSRDIYLQEFGRRLELLFKAVA